jgi:subtilase family serine protease
LAAVAVSMVAAPIASAGSTYYAVGKRACKPAKKAGFAACFADIRVRVKRGTKGARAFTPGAGAIGPNAIGPAGGLTPSDIGTAYGLTTTGGSGQTVAIVDAFNDPKINADLQTFDTHYGLAACSTSNGCLKVLNQTGGTALPPNDSTGWSVEESLDVEAVHSVCQGCKIILYEATSNSNANLGTAENTAAANTAVTEITNSFGEPEAGTSSTFQSQFNHPGKVITASTGDDGYYNFDLLSSVNQPNIPAAYNTVVSVGGTSLYLGQTAARQSETVWNDNGPNDYWEAVLFASLGAGGGGCSTLFTAQGWQSSLSVYPSTACGTKRLDADVSAVADYLTGFDVYDSYTCASGCVPSAGYYTIGGTSLSSPVVAAIYGLAGGAHGISYPALTLYGHPNTAYDVTTGGNGFCGGGGAAQCNSCYWASCTTNPNLLGFGVVDCAWNASGAVAAGDRACDALAGYDGPTGVGTPKGLTTFTKTQPTVTITGPSSIAHGTSGTWKATVTDPFPGGHPVSYTFSWGDGTANTVVSSTATSLSASHTYAAAASRTITVTVKDNYSVIGSRTFPVKVT